MGRSPCCSKVGLHRGAWSFTEDTLLTQYIEAHGEGSWRSLPKKAGLLRCGKSCRLRWLNYLRPGIKRGNFTPEEEDLILRLHSLLGNRWSLIAGRLPGRTDNEIKNYWNTNLRRKLKSAGIVPTTGKELPKQWNNNNKSINNSKRSNPNVTNKGIANSPKEESKVYAPKPIRLSSFSFTMNNNLNSHSSSNGGANAEQSKLGCSWFELIKDCSTDEGVIQKLCDGDYHHDHELFSGCDLSFQCGAVPTNDGMLEKLYDEYLQLL